MRAVQVSELKERLDEVIEAVRNGETVEIWEGEACIAAFVPKVRAVDRS
jgi:antitoxin (DNA-binding transcriptional repressor) of toxin-antitoxin stability system